MHRERLRALPDLALTYAELHQHDQWDDHLIRVRETISFGRRYGPFDSVADLSCGDGAIALALHPSPKLGDLAPGHPIIGPLDRTLSRIRRVDLYVCSETLEHLDDPDLFLSRLRGKAERLLLTTPVGAWGDINPEHVWAWDRQGVEEALVAAGWTVDDYEVVKLAEEYVYDFGLWFCS